ncbi:MAG: hypothetical protein IT450_10850 [Phycisphaerales bacterium]|nr:hypothetical protein [Phycisphaerales bacterium]
MRRIDGIPKGTALDPAQFPENDYPVHCLECGYALQGLPDGRCPECGHAFVRGELIVEIYARVVRPRRDTRRRLSWTLCVIGWVSLVLFASTSIVLGWIGKLYFDSLSTVVTPTIALRFGVVLFAMLIGGNCALLASLAIEMTRWPHGQKRKAAHRAVKVQLAQREKS